MSIDSLIGVKVCRFWRSYLSKDKAVLVAVSGGSDSVALIHLLSALREKLQVKKLAVAHVNHGLRGEESDGDEHLVRRIASDLDIPFFLKRLSGHNLKDSGIEQWARDQRYRFFHSIRESCGFDLIATGHTADDQAETMLFRMMRGAGVKGLRGILPVREDGVIRPLLFADKSELVEWLNLKGFPFRTDSSNADLSFSRNFIRHELLPVISKYQPDAAIRMTALSLQMIDTWAVIEQQTGVWIKQYVAEDSDDSFSIKKEGFQNRRIAPEALKSLFEKHGIAANRFHIENVFANINRSRTFLLPSKWQYDPTKEAVFFHRKRAGSEEYLCRIPIPGEARCISGNINFTVTEIAGLAENLSGDNWSVFMDRDSIRGNSLLYRQVNCDDVFCPFGCTRQTSVLRFLAKQGFSRIVRSRTGVVVDGCNKVLWIPGIRLNQLCAVSKASRNIIKIDSKASGNNV